MTNRFGVLDRIEEVNGMVGNNVDDQKILSFKQEMNLLKERDSQWLAEVIWR